MMVSVVGREEYIVGKVENACIELCASLNYCKQRLDDLAWNQSQQNSY